MWWNKIKNFISRINDTITIPIGIALVYYLERGVTYFFPGTTAYDPGFYYDLGYSISALFILHGVTSLLFKVKWSAMEWFSDMKVEEYFKQLQPYEKFKWAVITFFLYLYAAILTFIAVSGATL